MSAGMGVFAASQPVYAAHGVATFPLNDQKKPAVSNYQKMGLPASSRLADRFRNANGFGFMTNARSRIAVLDVDSTDERVLADAMSRHGSTPVVVRTASGKHHALYKHNGEFRKIRPFGDLPIDLLGTGGLAVAAPSRFERGEYSFIEGCLDDIERLPVMRGLDPAMYRPRDTLIVGDAPTVVKDTFDEPAAPVEGRRNDTLWRYCMQQLRITNADIDAIVAAARIRNATFNPPLPDEEVVKTASSAWGYTAKGCNRFGQYGSYLPTPAVKSLVHEPYLLALISWLQAENSPNSTFWVADGLADKLGWPRRQFANARRQAIEAGWIVPITIKAPGRPVSYRWRKQEEAERGVC
jgi:hypothetical protein